MYIPFSIGVAATPDRNDVLRLATGKGCGGMRVNGGPPPVQRRWKAWKYRLPVILEKRPAARSSRVGVQQGIKGGIPETQPLQLQKQTVADVVRADAWRFQRGRRAMQRDTCSGCRCRSWETSCVETSRKPCALSESIKNCMQPHSADDMERSLSWLSRWSRRDGRSGERMSPCSGASEGAPCPEKGKWFGKRAVGVFGRFE